jgi:polyribonucleotide nucleotidyltransferase
MEPNVKRYQYDFAGKTLEVEFGKVANLANGSCMIRMGDTVVLSAATGTKKPSEGIDFFPLTVEYEEKQYAVGKIPEASSSVKAVLLKKRP